MNKLGEAERQLWFCTHESQGSSTAPWQYKPNLRYGGLSLDLLFRSHVNRHTQAMLPTPQDNPP